MLNFVCKHRKCQNAGDSLIFRLPAFFFLFSCFFVIRGFGQSASPPPFIVAAYYENWSQFRPGIGSREPFSIDMIDPTLLTDLYYAFAVFGYVTPSMDPSN